MPRGRHAGKNKRSKQVTPEDAAEEISKVSFTYLENTSPLLTLLYDNKAAQHAALSRIEAFYESNLDTQTYLTLEESRQQRQCQYYEAFNFPIEIVKEWLRCMRKAHIHTEQETEVEDTNDEMFWWKESCNEQEQHLLALLYQIGALEEDDKDTSLASTTPIYVISTLASKQASLQHERLHFLFFVSLEYRIKVTEEYKTLSNKTLKIIEQDLSMRKYSSKVWIDEFQAYISEDAGEFGKSTQEECQVIKSNLNEYQRRLLKDFKLC